MTVSELITELQKLPPEAVVYTMAHDDDIALIVTNVYANVLTGKEQTTVLVY